MKNDEDSPFRNTLCKRFKACSCMACMVRHVYIRRPLEMASYCNG